MKTSLSLFAALFAALSISADEPMSRADADARAALALAKAKVNLPAAIAKTKPIPYAEAAKIAAKTGQPIFVVVGDLKCVPTCNSIRPDVITCHEIVLDGDKSPRAILCVPGKDLIYKWKEWTVCPLPETVKDEAKKARAKIGPMTAADHRDEMMIMVALGLIAVQPVEWVDSQPTATGTWQQVCENGVCRWVFMAAANTSTGFAPLPIGDGPSVAYVNESVEQQFQARFPRIAKMREKFRAKRDLPPPRVAGGFVSYPQIFPEAQPVESQVAGVVAGPLRNIVERVAVRRVLHSEEFLSKLTPEQRVTVAAVLNNRHTREAAIGEAHKLAQSRAKMAPGVVGAFGDGTILKMLLEALPQLIAMLKELLALFTYLPPEMQLQVLELYSQVQYLMAA